MRLPMAAGQIGTYAYIVRIHFNLVMITPQTAAYFLTKIIQVVTHMYENQENFGEDTLLGRIPLSESIITLGTASRKTFFSDI